MPNVEMEFTPKEQKLVQAMLRLNRQFDEGRSKARGFQQSSQQSSGAFAELGGQVASQLSGMLVGFASVTTVVNELRVMWQDWQQQITDTGNQLQEFTRGFQAQAVGRGDPYGVVQPGMIDIARQAALTRQEAIQLYAGVGGAMPLEADPNRVLEIARQAAQAKRLGLDPRQVGAVMGLMQRFALPEADVEQLSSVAISAIQNLGQEAGRLTSKRFYKGYGMLAQAGITGPEAVQMMIGAAYAGEGPTVFEQVVNLALRDREQLLLPPGQRGAIEDQRTRKRRELRSKYAAMSPEDFVRNMMTDKEAQNEFLPGYMSRLETVREGIEAVGPRVEEAINADLMRTEWDALKQDEQVNRSWQLEIWRSRKDLAVLTGGEAAARRAEQNLAIEREEGRLEMLVQRGVISPWEKRAKLRAFKVGVAGGLYESELDYTRTQSMDEKQAEILESQRAASNLLAMGYVDAPVPKTARGEAVEEVNTEMRKLAESTKEMNQEVDRSKDEAKAIDVGDRE